MHDHAGPPILGTASTVVLLPMQEEPHAYWHTAPCAGCFLEAVARDISDKIWRQFPHCSCIEQSTGKLHPDWQHPCRRNTAQVRHARQVLVDLWD